MNNSSTTSAGLDQADEDILTFDVSDEQLEKAAGRDVEMSSLWSSFVPAGCSCWEPGTD
jgi:hypothetical protein